MSVDFFFRDRNVGDAQITNFFVPAQTNAVNVQEYGAYIEKTFASDPANTSSITIGAGYSRTRQVGLVEFFPRDVEFVNQYSARVGMQTDMAGGKIVLNSNYDYQDIVMNNPNLYDGKRSIYGARLAFFTADAAKSGMDHGMQILAGAAHDVQWYGATYVPKNDYFGGLVLYGIRLHRKIFT